MAELSPVTTSVLPVLVGCNGGDLKIAWEEWEEGEGQESQLVSTWRFRFDVVNLDDFLLEL